MSGTQTVMRAAGGMAAGLVGTVLIQILQLAGQKKMPDKMPPIKQHPGEFMVEKVEKLLPPRTREHIPQKLEKAAAHLLGIGYGLTFGSLYGIYNRDEKHLLAKGSALGLATWATGYLGWLPATGLMPRISKQSPAQITGGITSHLAYGIATAYTLRLLRRKFSLV